MPGVPFRARFDRHGELPLYFLGRQPGQLRDHLHLDIRDVGKRLDGRYR
jgi:hypothetical protein